MVQGAQSSDPETQLDAVTKFRKLLSIGMHMLPFVPTVMDGKYSATPYLVLT